MIIDKQEKKYEELNFPYNVIAELIDMDSAMIIHKYFKRNQIIFPKDFAQKNVIEYKIIQAYADGADILELIHIYNLTERTIKRKLKGRDTEMKFEELKKDAFKEDELNPPYSLIAELLDVKSAEILSRFFGGKRVTFPKEFVKRDAITAGILKDYNNGMTIQELVYKYNLCDSTIRNKISQEKKKKNQK